MIRLALFSCALLVCLSLTAHAQMKDVYIPGTPPPPAPMDPEHGQASPDNPKLARPHVDMAKLQQEADELARTAQTVPTDIASVRQGTLPKDIVEKLKKIEKLSKRLRSELNP